MHTTACSDSLQNVKIRCFDQHACVYNSDAHALTSWVYWRIQPPWCLHSLASSIFAFGVVCGVCALCNRALKWAMTLVRAIGCSEPQAAL